MKANFFLLFFVLIEIPATENKGKVSNRGEYGDYFEGDMKLDDIQMSALLYPHQRSGLLWDRYRWPNNTVYYELSPGFGMYSAAQIRTALNEIESVSCLRFLPRDEKTTSYITIRGDQRGCFSEIGYKGKVQILNLHFGEVGKGCLMLSSIMHEFLHALGFLHQQSVYDRDKYVKIFTENIRDGFQDQFEVYPPFFVSHFGEAYDFNSIMHYDSYAFSKNGKMTIVPRIKGVKIERKKGLSVSDIRKLNRMYKCEGYDK